MTDKRLEELVDNMDADGAIQRFTVDRDEVIRVVSAAYTLGWHDAWAEAEGDVNRDR